MNTFCLPRALARTLVLISIKGAAALPAHVSAGPPPAPLLPAQLDPFTVEGRATDLIGTASSASQGIVGAPELSVRPFLRRGELLEVVPGVVITQHSGGGKANQYFLKCSVRFGGVVGAVADREEQVATRER